MARLCEFVCSCRAPCEGSIVPVLLGTLSNLFLTLPHLVNEAVLLLPFCITLRVGFACLGIRDLYIVVGQVHSFVGFFSFWALLVPRHTFNVRLLQRVSSRFRLPGRSIFFTEMDEQTFVACSALILFAKNAKWRMPVFAIMSFKHCAVL